MAKKRILKTKDSIKQEEQIDRKKMNEECEREEEEVCHICLFEMRETRYVVGT